MNSYEERVCDLIFSEGKLRDFGVYKRFDTNNTPSYWLFVRDGDNTVGADKEYELKLDVDWNITIIPKGVDTSPAIHKFSIQSIHYNCSVQRQVSPLIFSENNCNSYEFHISRDRVFLRYVHQYTQERIKR